MSVTWLPNKASHNHDFSKNATRLQEKRDFITFSHILEQYCKKIVV